MTKSRHLFELISQRYERGPTLITSNPPFDEWTENLRLRAPLNRPGRAGFCSAVDNTSTIMWVTLHAVVSFPAMSTNESILNGATGDPGGAFEHTGGVSINDTFSGSFTTDPSTAFLEPGSSTSDNPKRHDFPGDAPFPTLSVNGSPITTQRLEGAAVGNDIASGADPIFTGAFRQLRASAERPTELLQEG